MKEMFLAAVFATVSTLAIFALPTTAFAASTSDQVALCAAAADHQGVAGADYRAKFVKAKGGSVKTLTLKFLPTDGGDAITAKCRIENGEVTDISVKA